MSARAMRRWSRCVLVLLLTLGVSTGTASTAGATPSSPSPSASAASDDVAGLVDIGGRWMYLECRGIEYGPWETPARSADPAHARHVERSAALLTV